jgi:hypothetical protein
VIRLAGRSGAGGSFMRLFAEGGEGVSGNG